MHVKISLFFFKFPLPVIILGYIYCIYRERESERKCGRGLGMLRITLRRSYTAKRNVNVRDFGFPSSIAAPNGNKGEEGASYK